MINGLSQTNFRGNYSRGKYLFNNLPQDKQVRYIMAERARQNYNKTHDLKIQTPKDDIGTYVSKKIKQNDFLKNIVDKIKKYCTTKTTNNMAKHK